MRTNIHSTLLRIQVADWMHSDEGFEYDHEIDVDCASLEPMVARPGEVEFFLRFGSQDVRERSDRAGMTELLLQMGAQLVELGRTE